MKEKRKNMRYFSDEMKTIRNSLDVSRIDFGVDSKSHILNGGTRSKNTT